MTIKELVDLLLDCDPDAVVLDSRGNEIEEVDDQSEEGIVYIES